MRMEGRVLFPLGRFLRTVRASGRVESGRDVNELGCSEEALRESHWSWIEESPACSMGLTSATEGMGRRTLAGSYWPTLTLTRHITQAKHNRIRRKLVNLWVECPVFDGDIEDHLELALIILPQLGRTLCRAASTATERLQGSEYGWRLKAYRFRRYERCVPG
jgi:hypothetical protein